MSTSGVRRVAVPGRGRRGLSAFLETAPDAMLVVDGEGRIVLVNTQAEVLFGYARGELVGELIELLVPERFQRRHQVVRTEYTAKPAVRPMGEGRELFARRRDGTEFAVEISLSPMEADGERLVTAAVRDVTERRRADERFRGLLESAPDAMVIVDGEGRIVLVNTQTEQLFGYDRNELLGQPAELLMPERFREAHTSHREEYRKDPRVRPMGEGRELFARRRDGTEFPVEISLSPMRSGESTLVTAAIRDITERKNVEARLRASLREKDVLLKEIHHRVKNNLQIIVSLLNLQSGSTGDAVSYEALAESRNRVKSMALVHEALYRSPDLSGIDFGDYVEHLSRELCRSYGTDLTRVRLHLDVAHVQLAVDPALHFGLVLNELLSNSLKHAFPGGRAGTVRVGFHEVADGGVVLEVVDDGVGIPPDVTPETARTLGLQLVSTLARQLGGFLEALPGSGTGFRVTFSGGGSRG